ncbi:MAG: ABC transporter permease subunit, partial [Chloroflexota bacterium]
MAVAADTTRPDLSPKGGPSILQKLRSFILSPRWLAIALALLLWQLVAMQMNTRVVPPPARVFSRLWEILSTGLFFEHLWASMVRILSGFSITLLVGAIVGVLMGSRRTWEALFRDVVVLGLTMPGLIYALLSVMFFGLSLLAPITAIVFASYPFVAVNVREGVRALDKDLLDMSRAYGVNRSKVVSSVILPALLPFFLAAIRVGFAIAWKVSTLVEVFGATSGVGFMIRSGFDSFSVPEIGAWALLFGGVMLLIE